MKNILWLFSILLLVYTIVSDRGGKFRLPLGRMLPLDTHPYGSHREPSDGGKTIAAPNCVVMLTEVWCATPNGMIAPSELSGKQQAKAHSSLAPAAPKPWKFHTAAWEGAPERAADKSRKPQTLFRWVAAAGSLLLAFASLLGSLRDAGENCVLTLFIHPDSKSVLARHVKGRQGRHVTGYRLH